MGARGPRSVGDRIMRDGREGPYVRFRESGADLPFACDGGLDDAPMAAVCPVQDIVAYA